MKESYGEGIASHTGPESCVTSREDSGEALTGVRAGRVLRSEISLVRGADAVEAGGRPHWVRRYRETHRGPAESQTPCMYVNISCESREIPCLPAADGAAGRFGKPQGIRR